MSSGQSQAPPHWNEVERNAFAAFADALLPGAAAAGVVRYVEDQLASPTPLLFLKYMDYPGSCSDFYRHGLRALDDFSLLRFGQLFAALGHTSQTTLIRELSQNTPPAWQGPPAPLFYFVVRNDALDVCYGTPEGFDKLGVPYMPLIPPPSNW